MESRPACPVKRPPAAWIPGASVVLLAMVLYANSFPGAFILDDVLIIRDNPIVRNFDLAAIFSSDFFGTRANSGTYRPLTVLSFAVNHYLFGPGVLSFHLVNVLMHAGASLLFYLLLCRLPLAPGVSWLGAALFAAHPIHDEAVNTVVGRAELLVAAFTLLGLLAALGRGRRHRALTLLWYSLALLSKENAQSFLPMLVCVDAFTARELKETLRGRRHLYALLVGVTIAWLVLRTWALAQNNLPHPIINRSDNPVLGLAFLPRLLSAGWIQLLYLRNLVFPHPLLGVYTANYVGSVDALFSLRAAGVAASAALLVFFVVRGWRQRRGHALGMALYLAAFLVNLNVFLLTYVAVADRLAYLPSAGFCLAAASLLLAPTAPLHPRHLRLGACAAAAGFLLLLSGLTLVRNRVYSSPLRLWQDTVRADPRSGRGWLYLADNLELAGRIEEAQTAYRTAVEVEPEFHDSHTRYSRFLLDAGRPEEALRHAEEVRRLVPGAVGPAHIRGAQALIALGRPREALGWLDQAKSTYHSEPTYLETMGKALDALGDAGGAIHAFERVVRQGDANASLTRRLAELLIDEGDPRGAEKILVDELAARPEADTHNLLGVSLALQGRHVEAVAAFETAARLSPEEPLFKENLDNARADAAAAALGVVRREGAPRR